MNTLIALAYLLAAVLFILGLKQLSSPKGARNGNFTAALGMVIALAATVPLLHFTRAGAVVVAIGVVTGTIVGTVGARMVRMTAIPQMVAVFNGVGGGAAAVGRPVRVTIATVAAGPASSAMVGCASVTIR